MAVFNVASTFGKKKTSQDYGFLMDQVEIKKNELEFDGKLSPGDYDLLVSMAQKLALHPGLSSAQRSQVNVKISQLEKEKTTNTLKKNQDIGLINREVEDDFRQNTLLLASDPKLLLETNSDVLQAKIAQLSEAIDRLEVSGGDYTTHLNEYNDTINQYQDILRARQDVEGYKGDGKPFSNYVSYITTNSNGEVVDVQIGRTGSKTGYVETNGLYGGLQVYGKINRKEFGKNIFLLGNDTFSAADFSIPDPNNPGATKYNPLISKDQQTSLGNMTAGTIGVYKDVDLNNVRAQSYIPDGSWAEGEKGTLYKKLPDGNFVKYVSTSKEALQISDSDIIKIPKSFESGINARVNQTVDGSNQTLIPANFEIPTSPAPGAMPTQPSAPENMSAQPTNQGTARTPAPVVRSSQEPGSVVQKTLQGAKNFFSGFFNR